MILLKNPTNLAIRGYDKWGSGLFGAKRGNRLHAGVDFVCVPGQDIYSPINGTIVREAYPYAGDLKWCGCVIASARMRVKIFYMRLFPHMVGKIVAQGDVIGVAQDVSHKYPGITPHIHLEIEEIDPELLLNIERIDT